MLVLPGALLVGGTAALARRADAPDPMATINTVGTQESVQQANDYMTKLRATETRITKLQDQARAKRDVIKLNCVSDKLVQLKGHLKLANTSNVNLQTAVSRGDEAARRHELTRMTIIYQKGVVLGTEAENCVGEDASYVGETRVDVEIDPNIPDEDPTEPQLPLPDVTRPPEASPFV
jgi:hypothetical protein